LGRRLLRRTGGREAGRFRAHVLLGVGGDWVAGRFRRSVRLVLLHRGRGDLGKLLRGVAVVLWRLRLGGLLVVATVLAAAAARALPAALVRLRRLALVLAVLLAVPVRGAVLAGAAL